MRYIQTTFAISMAAVLWVCAAGTTLPAAPLQESEAGGGGAGRGMLCEERPAGRATGVGNTQLYNICIAPLPPAAVARGDQICEQAFGGWFRAVADLEALVNCVTLHNVQEEIPIFTGVQRLTGDSSGQSRPNPHPIRTQNCANDCPVYQPG